MHSILFLLLWLFMPDMCVDEGGSIYHGPGVDNGG